MKERITWDPKLRALCAKMGAVVNEHATQWLRRSRSLVRYMNHHVTNQQSDWFIDGLPGLHRQISDILRRQKTEYGSLQYFYGYPYQALGILNVYGERGTEERFDAYGIADLVTREDRVLDIGCNCGFMAVLTAYRTGCSAVGIDINPYMAEIGTACARYLRLENRVTIMPGRIQEFSDRQPFTVVFSFATHWTDDFNYRVPLREHFERCYSYLARNGLLVFETHAADVGSETFYAALEEMSDLFALQSMTDTDNKTRHLYLYRRIG
jgi:SAM-dependent methyltransferase